MLKQYLSLFFTQTGKDTLVNFSGTLINVLLGALFFILAPRILGPAQYGIFAVVMATGLMAVNFANFGIDTGLLRFIKPGQEETNQKILKLAFKAYIGIGLLIFILGFVLSGTISNLLNAPQTKDLLRIAFAGTIFTLISNFFIANLQSKKEFLKASAVNISANAARLLLLAAGSYFLTVDLYFLTVLFFFVTIISTILGKILVPFDFLKAKEENMHFKKFFGYNSWIAASLAISAIPIDNYLLVKIAGPLATGLYAAPLKILTTTYQFAGSFSRVLAPRFSSFDTNMKAKEFSIKASGFVLAVCTLLVGIGFLANPFVNLFLGNQYEQSIPVFRILSIGMAFFFADTIPMAAILYYFGKSKIAFFVTVWHYLIYTILLFILIPIHKEIGAAWGFTISEIITFITLISYIIFKFRK